MWPWLPERVVVVHIPCVLTEITLLTEEEDLFFFCLLLLTAYADPTPTEEADGNGYGAIAGRGGPPRPPPRAQALT